MAFFVAIEGLDGVGKSTVVKHLANMFNGHAMSTPGEELRDVRQSILVDFKDNEPAKALFYAVTVASQGEKARTLAARGECVFMDRYWPSTISYAKARGVAASLDQLSKIMVQPDLTILLVLKEPERQKRLHDRGATTEDMETLNSDFRQCVLDGLYASADVVVDISGYEPLEAALKIAKIIREHLSKV